MMHALILAMFLMAQPVSSQAAPIAPRTDHGGAAPVGVLRDREGGETIGDAILIAGLPFDDTGNTCTNANDYDAICPYGGSTAPDVVYKIVPTSRLNVSVDLCSSEYDTKLYVYRAPDFSTPIACNDDGCGYTGWQSWISQVIFEAGYEYYIVVDGYGASCGSYFLHVEAEPPCDLPCPDGALHEAEPLCADGYQDGYNSGCSGAGWTAIVPTEGNCGTICGRSCGYLQDGVLRLDSDWYTAVAGGGDVRAICEAEFPFELSLFWVSDCDNPMFGSASGGTCTLRSVSDGFVAGAEFWVRVTPQVSYTFPEADYVLTVCGIQSGPVPITPTTWGSLKSRYR